MKKRLLYAASTKSHINNFHLPYLELLKQNGWDVDVLIGAGDGEISGADKTIAVPMQKRIFSPSNLGSILKIHGIIRRGSYDMIIMHTALASFCVRLALPGIGKRPRTVNVVHGYLFDESGSKIRTLIFGSVERVLAPLTDKVICMNRYDYNWAKRNKAAKEISFINGMGVPAEKFCAQQDSGNHDKGKLVLAYAAELSKRKNQMFLINAMAGLPAEIELVLAGDGALREKCIELARELGLENRVHFPGYVTDIPKLYRDSDIIVSSSKSEGLPFNIIEAMLNGKLIIASNVKGHNDLIVNGQNGFLYTPDDEKSLREILLKILDKPELIQKLGQQAHSDAERYTLDKVKLDVLNAYLS